MIWTGCPLHLIFTSFLVGGFNCYIDSINEVIDVVSAFQLFRLVQSVVPNEWHFSVVDYSTASLN